MTTQETIKFVNKVNKEEAEDILQILISSLIFDSSKNTLYDLTSKEIFISFFSVSSISKHSGALISSKLMPPKVGSKFFTV